MRRWIWMTATASWLGCATTGCSSSDSNPSGVGGQDAQGPDSSLGGGAGHDAAAADAGYETQVSSDGSGSSVDGDSAQTVDVFNLERPCGPSDAGSHAVSFINQTTAGDPRARTDEAVFSFINTVDDPHGQTMRLHNGGASAILLTSVGIADNNALFPVDYRQHSVPTAFQVSGIALPATIAPGEDLAVEVKFRSTQTSPPTRFDNVGGEAVAALLVVRTDSECAQAGLYGVSLWNNSESVADGGMPTINYARYEPTFGQILATLGYRVNVGSNLKAFLNVNQVDLTNALAPPPAGDSPSDEVVLSGFVKADPTQPVSLLSLGRFSPKLDMPYGYYTLESVVPSEAQPAAVTDGGATPAWLQPVAVMASTNNTDLDRSDHSEMLFPPLKAPGNTDASDRLFSFDPGSAAFGIWAFTGQRSYGTVSFTGGYTPAVTSGDFMYTSDALNIIAAPDGGVIQGVHRARVYPLKDRAGTSVTNAYLIGWEEAANGDYQDYVFILGNVRPASGSGDAAADVTGDAASTSD